MLIRTARPEVQALSCCRVKPTAVSTAEAANGRTLALTLTRIVLPCTWMPAFGLESIEARQNSFGAVAPVASVTVWACQPFGFCLESRPIAGWIVATKALLVPTSTQAKPTTGFERMKASGCRGMVAPVVTDSFARCPCCALAVNDTSAR